MLYFICGNVCIVYYVIRPQSLSDGRLLVFPCWVVLLIDRYADGLGPVGAATEAVVPCGCVVVHVFLFERACCAVVGGADWVETVRETVAAHVAWLGHLLDNSSVAAATTVLVGVVVLPRGKFGNGCSQLFDLR